MRQIISKAMVRLTRPMPLGFYILVAFVFPIVVKLLLVFVAATISFFR